MALEPYDLDAARREVGDPDGIPIVFGGVTYMLAAQLPVETFDAFLDEDLDLVGAVSAFMDGDEDGDGFLDALLARPTLPAGIVTAIHTGLAAVFGADQYEKFRAGTGGIATKPQVPDLARLVAYLAKQYGVGLGKAFRSLISSDDGGATSKPTSPASVSTPAKSSAKRTTRVSSGSVVSGT